MINSGELYSVQTDICTIAPFPLMRDEPLFVFQLLSEMRADNSPDEMQYHQ